MWRLFFVLLLCSCGDYDHYSSIDRHYDDFQVWNQVDGDDPGDDMSTYPPDGWEVYGTDVTWASDFDIQNGIGEITGSYSYLGSYVRFTTTVAHGLEVGQWVRISGTTDYNGEYVIQHVIGSTSFTITDTYVSNQTGTYRSNTAGPDCIKFEDTTPTGNPGLTVDPPIAVREGEIYRMTIIVQTTSIAGGNTVAIGVNWFDGNGTYLSSSTIHNAVLPSAGSWHTLSGIVTAPENARSVALAIHKANNAFFIFLDDFNGTEMPIAFFAYGASTTIAESAVTQIEFDTEMYDYGSIYDATTNYRFTASVAGLYTMDIAVDATHGIDTFNDDDSLLLYLYKNGGLYMTLCRRNTRSAESSVTLYGGSGAVYVDKDDYFDVRVGYVASSGSDAAVASGNISTRFVVAKVE